jgi:hypothetical protein
VFPTAKESVSEHPFRAAVRNLEAFKQQLDEADQSARAEQKERRERMYGKPEVAADAPDYNLMRTERQEAAHEAWAKAHRDNQVKYDVLQHAPAGALVEQFHKYKRCRRCKKTIGETIIVRYPLLGLPDVQNIKKTTLRIERQKARQNYNASSAGIEIFSYF